MTYVTSDLHGYPFEEFQKLLASADFGADDTLYILGDVVDRGADCVRILLWIMEQPNVRLLIGNHEMMMIGSRGLLGEVTDELIANISSDALVVFDRWMRNGGDVTARALNALTPEKRDEIIEYLLDCSLYEQVTAGGREYLLCHSGPGNFAPDRPIEDYTADELTWHRPAIDERFYENGVTVVFGHTPTVYYDRGYRGRAIFTDTWINVDCGAASGIPPMLLRLDDLKEFYLS